MAPSMTNAIDFPLDRNSSRGLRGSIYKSANSRQAGGVPSMVYVAI
jgi:hypothetical protein